MRILNFISLWRLCKWVAIIIFGYALINAGISPAVICLFFMIKLAVRLFFHCIYFIGTLINIAVTFIILIILISIIL